MNTKASRLYGAPLVAALLSMLLTGAAFAAEPSPQAHPALTKEQRESMAAIHEQMAACLRSDKPVADCHKEAMKKCQETMGKDGCPMMHEHMMHEHMMHEHTMQPSSKPDGH
jgi:uncharacterized cupredoxin-like copper-binding protein